MSSIQFGNVTITPRIQDQRFLSLGDVKVGGTPLRNNDVRFLPWFDTYRGDVFYQYEFDGITQEGSTHVISLTAIGSNEHPFSEKRDTSGDPCFRTTSWDDPVKRVKLRICIEPARDQIDGLSLSGFRYWYEGSSEDVAFHRFLDRQTWEVGGHADQLTIVLRNWLTPPRVVLKQDKAFSTAGFEKEIGCMPGNLWARWTLLPAFDLQRSDKGVLVAYYDNVSLIRGVIEKGEGDDHLRFLELHLFEEGHRFKTNPKTVLHSAERLVDVDLMNLWTRLHDRERDKARAQFGIKPETAPELTICKNIWLGIRFDESYNDAIDLASELNMDNVMIDPIWESGQTQCDELAQLNLNEKFGSSALAKLALSNQCEVIDLEIDRQRGGEEGLKRVCDYGTKKGVKILSWIATHISSRSFWTHGDYNKKQGHGKFGIFAAKESGLHPDTGYASACWALNLNAPIADYVIDRIKDVCKKTGLKGFLWDSFSNLGWWHIDYSKGDLKPQFQNQARVYSELANEGLYLMPEAITAFSSHSCLGMFGGDAYKDDDLGYSYDTAIHGPYAEGTHETIDCSVLRGKLPISVLFRYLAHKRAPNMTLFVVKPEDRSPEAIRQMRELFTTYKKVRNDMHKRTVLKEGKGVLWESQDGRKHLWAFKDHDAGVSATHVMTGQTTSGAVKADQVYTLA